MFSKKTNAPKKANSKPGVGKSFKKALKNGNNGGGMIRPGLPVRRPPPVAGFPQKRPVSAAAAYATGQSSSAPKLTANRDSCRIVHRELVSKILVPAAFSIQASLALNPGLSATFPWLSTQAGSWEQYRFNRLRACYYTRTGSTTIGSVQLVPDYDPADAPPISEFQASTYEDMQEDAPWKDIVCELRPDAMFPMGPKKFIRASALAANQDIKTYDAGNLYVTAVDGTGATAGCVWLEYDVTLFCPQAPADGIVIAEHITSPVPTSAALLPTPTVTTGSTLILASLPGAEVITFGQAGRYMITYNATATTSVTETAVPVVSATGSFVTTFGLNGTGYFTAGSGTTAFISTVVVNVIVGTTVTYNNTIVAGLLAEMIISRLPVALA